MSEQSFSRELHQDGSASAQWQDWSTNCQLTVTDSEALEEAILHTKIRMTEIELACSRFRSDSELMLIQGRQAEGVQISALLAELVSAALLVARWTEGAVDPTMGKELRVLGYDRDFTEVKAPSSAQPIFSTRVLREREPRWEEIVLHGTELQVPSGIELDLGASAKAFAADLIAAELHDQLGCGVLVSLGGDLRVMGAAPELGWQIAVQDLPGDPSQQVSLNSGAVATSSTQKRRWAHQGQQVHHILDPRWGLPAKTPWRSASVAANSCLRANAFSTAALVKGEAALTWLAQKSISARLVDESYRVHLVTAWPERSAETATEVAARG
ncbi:thiamine biosynthesis lipoprotein [Psychromicrobium silvestre]|uniref:FAD:protein FMN transferase n=1 Tax=Psychromicrobium silvestre TaxID=1645614 RepID=A0A7Y9LT89_9MICC|nr:FAD:protein FMN transferase [Psychromicrobium silvestre]NYE95198.1 thiamine biosynthesis lipoprotein [Psychromicrobium silvestre]